MSTRLGTALTGATRAVGTRAGAYASLSREPAMMTAGVEQQAVAEGGRLGELYVRHADDATRLAYLLTGDRALAEDVVQDAFVKLAGRLAHLRDEAAFPAYLRRTVVNLCNSHYRRLRLERSYLKREQGSFRTETWPAGQEWRGDLWKALQALSARQRAAIVLRFYEDLSEHRVAEILRCRPGTVKSLVSRGLETLRQEVRGE